MKSKTLFLVFALISAAALGVLPACSKAGQMAAHDDDVDYYTCAMHPSVKSHNPKDKCPICSMDLLPVMKRDNEHAGQTAATGMSGMSAEAPNTPTMMADQPGEFVLSQLALDPAAVSAGSKGEPCHFNVRFSERHPIGGGALTGLRERHRAGQAGYQEITSG